MLLHSHHRSSSYARDRGFTLFELLIVITILGILAAIVLFATQDLTTQSAKTACVATLKTVEIANEAYAGQVGHHPEVGDMAALSPGGAQVAGGLVASANGVDALFTTQPGLNGATVGPWLKDEPVNGSHYQIWLSTDGNGTLWVNDAAGFHRSDCSGVT